LDRTDDSKTVLSFLHSGRYSLTLADPSRDIWWHIVWQRCEPRDFTIQYVHVLFPWSSSHNRRWIHVSSICMRKQTQTDNFIASSISTGVGYKKPTLLPSTDSDTS